VAAAAQSIIRDAEIERALQELAAPVFRAAGLPQSTQVIIVNDGGMNAFVADARHVFLTSGLLLRLDSPDQVQAVLAHEAAHIANGHLTRRPAAAASAQTAARMGLLLAIAAGAASGEGGAAAGLAAGTMSAAQRSFFAHTRAEEASADQSALRYMVSTGIDPAAMLEVLDLFRGQEALSAARQDAYVRSHPLTRDRYRTVQAFLATRGAAPDPSAASRYWYARLSAKLSAFLRAPSWTLRRVGPGDTGEIATLRRAIAYHRQPDTDRALAEIGRLLRMRPNDPFYRELQGQILYESRRFEAAVAAYASAVDLAPREALILAGYGRALLALDRPAENVRALEVLTRARARDPFDPRMLRDLALAHARAGQPGLAATVSAERYAVLGRMDDAEALANRAAGLLPQGSPGWIRAQDVLRVAEAAQRRR
jgi:predicted Zn-dependent protease